VRALRLGSAALTMSLLLAGCHGDRDQLGRDLKSERPEVRAGALRRLAELHDEQDLPVFIARSQDASAGVRRASAEALGSTTSPHAVDVLGTLLSDPDEDVQSAAAQSLAKFPGEKAHGYLMSAYARRGTATRAAIGKAFGYGPLMQEAIRKEADGLWERNARALENGSSAEKVGAAEEVGRSGRTDAVERLIPLLGNDAILLAAGAARGLGAAGDIKAGASLMAVLKENYPALREAAAEALGDLGDPQAAPALVVVATGADAAASEASVALARLPRATETDAALCQVAAASGNVNAAAIAAKAMAARGGCPLPPLLARLGKGSAETRGALGALAALDGSEAEVVPRLTPLVDDKDVQIRIAAIAALGAVGAPAAAPPLLKLVKAEAARLGEARGKWVKEALPRTYAPGFESKGLPPGIDGAAHLDELEQKVHANNVRKAAEAGQTLHSARSDSPREVVPDVGPDEGQVLGAAAAALGRTHAEGAAELLAPLATDADDAVREGALIGLSYLGGPGLAAVQGAWGSLSAEAVPRVAAGLTTLGAAAIPALTAGLTARISDRSSIALALGKLSAKDAVAPLEALLASPGEEAAAAATALGELGLTRSVKPLADLLKDPRTAGRVEAIEALGHIKDAAGGLGREAITRELFSDHPESRSAAVRALAAAGPGSDGPMLTALRADYYREVRRAAEQALSASPAAGK
jgi:HEAT repeat protein